MRTLLLISLFIGGLFGGPSAPQQAEEKFKAKQFADAARLYQEAIERYPGQRAALEYNIGQAYLFLDSTHLALNWWGRAAESKLQEYPASYGHNNVGVLTASTPATPPAPAQGPAGASAQAGDPMQQQLDQMTRALESFKSAMRRLPENDIARYNYEVLKRRKQQLEQQQQQQQQNQENQDQQQNQDQQKEEKDDQQQNQQQDKKRSKSNTEKQGQSEEEQAEAEQMGMQEAKMLLEAMKENEKKFLQQLEKSKKHRPNRQDGPDW
jgi:flagellar biosynthesis GTPase FlhF